MNRLKIGINHVKSIFLVDFFELKKIIFKKGLMLFAREDNHLTRHIGSRAFKLTINLVWLGFGSVGLINGQRSRWRPQNTCVYCREKKVYQKKLDTSDMNRLPPLLPNSKIDDFWREKKMFWRQSSGDDGVSPTNQNSNQFTICFEHL